MSSPADAWSPLMPALLLTSANFDAPERIAEDLTLPQGAFSPTVGLFFCDSQAPAEEAIALVQKNTPCPIIGGTSLTLPFSEDREEEDIAASLLLLQKENMRFARAVSEPLDPARHAEQMTALFTACRDDLGCAPALVLLFLPLMPGLPMDDFVRDVFDLAGPTPVFGGAVTNDLLSTTAAVFADGKAMRDRMVMAMFAGGIDPVFAVGASVTTMTDYAPTVTRSQGSTIFEVDGSPFCDYLRGLGIPPEDRINGVDALMQYGPTPADVIRPDRPDDGVPEIRCISYTRVDEGSAVFSGPMPEGSRLKMSVISREDVEHSARHCMDVLKSRMRQKEAEGRCFDVVLCVSCIARYFALIGCEHCERTILHEERPAGPALAGFYGFSEIAPTLALDDGRPLNRSHSASLIMCAL